MSIWERERHVDLIAFWMLLDARLQVVEYCRYRLWSGQCQTVGGDVWAEGPSLGVFSGGGCLQMRGQPGVVWLSKFQYSVVQIDCDACWLTPVMNRY